MSLNVTCPKCGSAKCELKQAKKSHWFIKYIIFGIPYLIFLIIKWMLALMILIVWDWWFAIIMKAAKKRYLWISKNLMKSRKIYYCHDCGNNFKA